MSDSSETSVLLQRVAAVGDDEALGSLLTQHRDRLHRMLGIRMDIQLRARVDPSDVIQETFIEASRRIDSYLEKQEVPFFLWLRFLAVQKLKSLYRTHCQYQVRDAHREASIYSGPLPEAASAVLAAQLVGRETTPSQVAVKAETQRQLQEALESMDPIDREILVLRHFEQLSNVEAAQVLGIGESTASSRHLRATRRLRQILESHSER